MKVCPVCKSRCFDDMDICYGCLYDFTKDSCIKNNAEVTSKIDVSEVDGVFKDENEDNFTPEFFELDTFPYIEETDYHTRGAHEKVSNINTEKQNLVIKIEIPKDTLYKYII